MFTRTTLIAGVLSAATLFTVTASAQVGNVAMLDREAVEAISIGGQFNEIPSSTEDVYTVPPGRRFHMTDLMLTNYGNTAPCDVYISGKTYEFRVGPNSTLHLPMLTGPVFLAGETVRLVNTWRLPYHGNSCRPVYTVMGYLSKKAP